MSWLGRLGEGRTKRAEERSSALAHRVLFEMRLEQTANRVPLVFSVGFLAVRIGVSARELAPALSRLEQEESIVRDATGKYGLSSARGSIDTRPDIARDHGPGSAGSPSPADAV